MTCNLHSGRLVYAVVDQAHNDDAFAPERPVARSAIVRCRSVNPSSPYALSPCHFISLVLASCISVTFHVSPVVVSNIDSVCWRACK